MNAVILAVAIRLVSPNDFQVPSSGDPIFLILKMIGAAALMGSASGIATLCIALTVQLFVDGAKIGLLVVFSLLLIPLEVVVVAIAFDVSVAFVFEMSALDSILPGLRRTTAMIAGFHIACLTQLAMFRFTGVRIRRTSISQRSA